MIFEHLERWETRSLISRKEAEAIRAFERAEAGPARRVPLVTEALGYLGAALAMAAFVALALPRWTDLLPAWRLAILAVVTVLPLAAGWPMRANDEPATQRLAGVLWTLSAAGLAGFLTELLYDREGALSQILYDQGSETDVVAWAPFAVGVGTGLYARALQVLRPCAPLQVVVFAATLTGVAGAGIWAIDAGWTGSTSTNGGSEWRCSCFRPCGSWPAGSAR